MYGIVRGGLYPLLLFLPLWPAGLGAQGLVPFEATLSGPPGAPLRLLARAAEVGPGEARELRRQAGALLAEQGKQLSAKELRDSAREAAPHLRRAAATPAQVEEVLGTRRTVHRQLLYRRHVELWIYDRPLPLLVTLECPRGQPPRVRDVQVSPAP